MEENRKIGSNETEQPEDGEHMEGGGARAKKRLTGKHVALILGTLVIVAAAVVAILLLLRQEPEPEMVIEPLGIPVINMENVEEITAQIAEKVQRGMFETHMNVVWTFPDGRSPSSDAVMGNSANNHYPLYFTVTLSDTGETVFTSGLMPVGTRIAEITLDRELPRGDYDAIVGINMIDDDGMPMEGNMGINITLVIMN